MSALAFGPRLTCCRRFCWLLAACLLVLPLRVPSCGAGAPAEPPSSRPLPEPREAPASRFARLASARPGFEPDAAYDELPEDELEEEYVEINVTAEKSKYLGSPCDVMCNPSLQHVHCHSQSKICECEKSYPVQLGPTKGCAKPKKLGEQCLYQATCVYTDQHSTCTQVQHNAVCECEMGYHRSAYSRHKRQFCAKDLVLISTDLPTLLGVASGIAVFTGLICFVLKLFSRARYTRPRHYANAGQAPPMLFSSDTGIPLTLHGGRPSSRSSQRSSTLGGGGGGGGAGGAGSGIGGMGFSAAAAAAAHRKQSSSGAFAEGNSRAPLVPASRAGSRRPSVASIHSSTSSAKSYSARRFERERNEKEQRMALAELKREQQQQQQQLQLQPQQPTAPSPSPRTPHSTDELLPSVEEATEIFYNEQVPTTSGTMNASIGGTKKKSTTTTAATNEAISPLFEGEAKPCTSAYTYRS